MLTIFPAPAVIVYAADEVLNINTATADQLKALPGIGEAYSEKIMQDGRTAEWLDTTQFFNTGPD